MRDNERGREGGGKGSREENREKGKKKKNKAEIQNLIASQEAARIELLFFFNFLESQRNLGLEAPNICLF